jgi:multicomponent Na+:H+ antiporter subunit D
MVTAAATLAAGIFADSQWSPLYWAQLITQREYLRP